MMCRKGVKTKKGIELYGSTRSPKVDPTVEKAHSLGLLNYRRERHDRTTKESILFGSQPITRERSVSIKLVNQSLPITKFYISLYRGGVKPKLCYKYNPIQVFYF